MASPVSPSFVLCFRAHLFRSAGPASGPPNPSGTAPGNVYMRSLLWLGQFEIGRRSTLTTKSVEVATRMILVVAKALGMCLERDATALVLIYRYIYIYLPNRGWIFAGATNCCIDFSYF